MPSRTATRRLLLRPAAAVLAAVAASLTVLPATSAEAAACTAGTGPAQRKVERFLDRPVDGTNGRADCRAIRELQREYGIANPRGYAGPLTGDLVSRLRQSARRADLCTTRAKVVCVDLTSQTMWIARHGRTVWGPYPVRSGRDGYETRTGVFGVRTKDLHHVSSIFGSTMPFAMFFSGGQAFHTSDRYLYDPLGSHGCVHVLPTVAQQLWNRVGLGTTVQVFGRKPGT